MPPTPSFEDFDPASGPSRPELSQGQIDALTEALNQLTGKIRETEDRGRATTSPAGGMPQLPPDVPWWFKWKQAYPGQPQWGQGIQGGGPPSGLPQHPFSPPGMNDPQARQWWARHTSEPGMTPEGDKVDPEGFSFVRSFWRRKAKVRKQRSAAERAAEVLGEPPMVEEHRSPVWRKKRRPDTWFKTWTRRAGARVRGGLGSRAGAATQQGLGAAAQSLMWGGTLNYAMRRGIAAGAMAGGPAVAAVTVLGVAAIGAAKALNQMVNEQMIYNRHLAQASAQMAFVFAERDVQERMRDRERGDRLSNSARMLTQAEQFKEDQWKDIGIAWDRAKNAVGAAWEHIKGAYVYTNPLLMQVKAIEKIYQWLEDRFNSGTGRPIPFDQWARDSQQLDQEARKRKDPKWMPPKFN